MRWRPLGAVHEPRASMVSTRARRALTMTIPDFTPTGRDAPVRARGSTRGLPDRPSRIPRWRFAAPSSESFPSKASWRWLVGARGDVRRMPRGVQSSGACRRGTTVPSRSGQHGVGVAGRVNPVPCQAAVGGTWHSSQCAVATELRGLREMLTRRLGAWAKTTRTRFGKRRIVVTSTRRWRARRAPRPVAAILEVCHDTSRTPGNARCARTLPRRAPRWKSRARSRSKARR